MLSFRLSTTLLLAATCLLVMPGVSADSITTCENANDVQRLSCASGVIRVESALYGRMDSMTCSAGRPLEELANTGCAQEGTVDNLKRRCDGKMACEFTTGAVSTSDPCPGTYKYLQTNFTCLPALRMTTCEDSYGLLFCDVGQEIFVYGADYGRRDRTTCSHNRPASEIENVTCSHPTMEIATSCNGMNSCMVKASNSVFGNPCSGTYKYLEVAYACDYPSSSSGHEPQENSEEV